MEQERKSTLVSVVLYSLCSLIVGCAVGGTLLMKILTQDEAPASVPETVRAEQIETTDTAPSETTTTTAAADPVPEPAQLQELLSRAGELFTAEYPYTDSDRFELHSEVFGRRVPFTSSSAILTYSGTVTVSLPADAIVCAVDAAAKQITVTLPEPEVISHSIDTASVRSYAVDNSLFSESTVSDFLPELNARKSSILERVLHDQDILSRSLTHAQEITRGIFAVAAETKDYSVQFVTPELPVITTAPAETTAPPQTSFPVYDDNDPLFW